ncbi:putative ubiquitin-like activating enzyme [Aspergillus campestris IBT 28561]|uniref:NEDD8-activating enzyme E1 regulatory subunit n=1 Tax=Aspergillus campestris (strain IBT 28561) TaxID=1392248 RepID=A0A2I1D0I3_ASPC2|nr:putative ubiquitin-like activating enzyme [Aspergillus campestris IBT 28561]PKY03379.1 putative ubiquitin-like activating enzyme [Aspergillus campestris IBT 28561]
MADAFPQALAGPSSKERKYDRQLRLWAASGQQSLEESRVLLVNSDGPWGNQSSGVTGVVGVETLKNLVLPGVGGFTIVDPAVVTEPDLGLNFFLEENCLGKSRAGETCRLLRELNPDVEGSSHAKPIAEIVKEDPDFISRHQLVLISGPIQRSSLDMLCTAAKDNGIPVLYTRSVGFTSTFSLQLPDVFPIVETHPDPETTQDLRLLNPWMELDMAGARVTNLESLDDHEHGHVPYILLLLHYLHKWKQSHNGAVPSNYKEKTEFREMVRSGARTNTPEGGEENFDEAVAAVMKSLNPFSLRSSLREIFEMDECKNLRQDSAEFWIIAAAIHEFYKKDNLLPLPGSLPDMKAQSADYIALQNIYKAKARKDIEEVVGLVRSIEARLARPVKVSEKDVEIFCKNASHVKVIHGRNIPRLDGDARTTKIIKNNLTNSDSIISLFLAFQILDDIVTDIQQGNAPDESLDNDAVWNTHIDRAIGVITSDNPADIDEEARERIVQATQELRRTEGGELHNTSALTGGLVAQEALKVITRQYVPLDNTCIFDGVRSRSEMFKL